MCASVLEVSSAERPATLMVMALQPTKRGAWCRADRKKSYRLGDLSVLIGRLTKDGSAISGLVGGGLRGADRGERTWVARLAVPGASYATERVEGAVLAVASWRGHSSLAWPAGAAPLGSAALLCAQDEPLSRSGPNEGLESGRVARQKSPILQPPTPRL